MVNDLGMTATMDDYGIVPQVCDAFHERAGRDVDAEQRQTKQTTDDRPFE